MGLSSPHFERHVRHLARRELRESPEQWRYYLLHRKAYRRTILAWLFRLALPIGAVLMPLCFTMPIIGMGVIAERGPVAGLDNGPHVILALHSLQVLGFLLILAGANDRAYFASVKGDASGLLPSANLRVFAYLPLRDREILRVTLLHWIVSGVALSLFVVFPYAYLAWKYTTPPGGWLISLGLLFIQLMTITAAVVLTCTYSPVNRQVRQSLILLGFAFVIGSIFLGFGGIWLPSPLVYLLTFMMYVTPGGWVSSAFANGLLENSKPFWLFLFPVLVSIAAASRLLYEAYHAGFGLKEFHNLNSGQCYAIIRQGFRVPSELPPPPPLFRQNRVDPGTDGPLVIPDELEAEAKVSEDQPLSGPLMDSTGFLQRLCDKILTSRERLIIRLWTNTYGRFTTQWYALIAALVISLFILLAITDAPPRDLHLALAGLPLVSLVFIRMCCTSRDDRRHAKLLMYYPVTFREVCRATLKRELFRSLVYVPLLMGYGLIAATLTDNSSWQTIISATLPLGVLVCCQPILDCFKVSSWTNDTSKLRMWIFWLGGGMLFILAAFLACVHANLLVRCVGLVLTSLTSWAMYQYYARAYRYGLFDLTMPKSV